MICSLNFGGSEEMKISQLAAVALLALAVPLAAEEASGGPEPISPDRPDFTNGIRG